MLGLLLWSSLNQIFFNSRCRDLLGYVGKVLVLPMPQEVKVCIFLQELFPFNAGKNDLNSGKIQ